jgi:hypothetical protein
VHSIVSNVLTESQAYVHQSKCTYTSYLTPYQVLWFLLLLGIVFMGFGSAFYVLFRLDAYVLAQGGGSVKTYAFSKELNTGV